MKKYECILFDADDTLFSFDAFSGLQTMFADYGVQFTAEHFSQYSAVSKPLWLDYQNGLITAEQLQHRRFQHWADHLQVLPQTLNSAFLQAMVNICAPLAGAENLLKRLHGKARLGIITNGFTRLQQARLERTGLRQHFEVLVISEQIGMAKPHRDIFDHALSLMGNPSHDKVLMVGDNVDSDIVGGINAGLDTCWINPENRMAPDHIKPTFQVASLGELENILFPE